MDIYVHNTLTGLVPLYPSDYDNKKRLKIGEDYLVTIKKPRSLKFHKKFFALLNMGFSNQEQYDIFEDYRAVMIMKAGFYKAIETDRGVVYLPKSISFASMENLEFEELYSKMIDVLIKELGLTEETIEKELSTFM